VNFDENNLKNSVFLLLTTNNQNRGSEDQTCSNRTTGKLEGKLKTGKEPPIQRGKSSEYNQNCTGHTFLACLLIFPKI